MQLCASYTGIFDLLLVDVIMPEMNGRDLANKVKTIFPDIKILFMSGHTADVIEHQGILEEGEFYSETYSFWDISAKITKHLI